MVAEAPAETTRNTFSFKPGGNHRNLHFITNVLIDHSAKNDVGIIVCRLTNDAAALTS